MKIESTGLPTVLDEKRSSGLIELSLRTTGRRLLVSTAHILMVGDDLDEGSCIFFGDIETYLEVSESYDKVKRLIEEATE